MYQTELAECGLACIAMVADFHGLDTDLGTLRLRFPISSRGAALSSLIRIADAIGLGARAVKVPLEHIDELALPAILHWDLNHYVVLERTGRRRALIHDPNGSSGWISFTELSAHFTGVALELRPTVEFEAGDVRQKLRLTQLWRRLSGLTRALSQTILLSVLLQAVLIASPYYMQLAIDSALPAQDRGLLGMLAFGFALLVLVNAAASLLRSFVLLSAGTSLSLGLSANLVRRLFRLPVDWFARRHTGDVLSRFQSILPIRTLLTEGAVAAVVDGGLTVITFVVMILYSPVLALISALACALLASVRWISFPLQRNAQAGAIIAAGKEQTTLIESLRGITTLRLFNRETVRHALWQSRLTDFLNANIHVQRLAVWQSVISTAVAGLENIVTIWLAVNLAIDGRLSVGMVFAYLAYKTQFLAAASSLIERLIAFRMIDLHLERLADIALADEDVGFQRQGDGHRELRGQIELRNISYRYGSDDPLVLRDVSMVITPGESVAITGASGGGKSTLAKILLGLIEPEGGEVLVDGQPLRSFGYASYRDQVSGVLQDDALFSGTIASNIAMFDEMPDRARIIEVATAAAISLDIEAMPMGYETLVGDMGSSLSGGQRQRVLLARALYRRPKMLVIDEGTSHLDHELELRVNSAISGLGVTRILIAHRKETIASADRVVVLDSGSIRV